MAKHSRKALLMLSLKQMVQVGVTNTCSNHLEHRTKIISCISENYRINLWKQKHKKAMSNLDTDFILLWWSHFNLLYHQRSVRLPGYSSPAFNNLKKHIYTICDVVNGDFVPHVCVLQYGYALCRNTEPWLHMEAFQPSVFAFWAMFDFSLGFMSEISQPYQMFKRLLFQLWYLGLWVLNVGLFFCSFFNSVSIFNSWM